MPLPADQLQALLLQARVIDEKKLAEIVEFSKDSGTPFEDALIERDVITDDALGKLIAESVNVPFVMLSKVTIPEDIFRIVPERIARKYNVLAFARDEKGVHLAMSDPTNVQLQEFIARKTGQTISPYFATARDINNSLQIYRKDLQKTFDELLKEALGGSTNIASDAPVAKIVDLLITYAYRDKASDIHIEPQEQNSLIRFRIDGILHDMLYLDKRLHDRIITRIKVLSRLRTDEHLNPQDGKMRMPLEEEVLDLRVSLVPVAEGEKAVLRLLASHFRQFSLLDLGMNVKDLGKVNKAMTKSYGMILSTGPTGSGKTTSIYSLLKILNTRDRNITTIEDPVEYRIKGVNQIQVNDRTNLTFANGLRSILRQDPNVIFVGEIRDTETAGIAVNAALTGHLVVSTLHTNDAATAFPRLVDMKVEPFLVASTVNIIIGQRLVRKICDVCKTKTLLKRSEIIKNLPEESITRYFGHGEDINVSFGKGCKICHLTGYAGRIGVFEVIEVTPKIKELVTEKADSDLIAEEARREGATTMMEDGLDKVAKGITTLEEVLRVTKVEML